MMQHRFSKDFWNKPITKTEHHSPELKSWIAKVLQEAADNPDGASEIQQTDLTENLQTDLQTECHSLGQQGTVFVPKGYEANYPYPLIVWIGDTETKPSPQQFEQTIRGISDRNYLAFLPGDSLTEKINRMTTTASQTATPPSESVLQEILDELRNTISEFHHDYHLHTERIILAGEKQGATAALSLLLSRPEWFGGTILLDPKLSPQELPAPQNHNELQQKPLFIANSSADDQTETIIRQLHLAGLSIKTEAPLNDALLSQLNDWIMESLCQFA